MKYPFVKCLNPVKTVNPYTKETLVVPCGRCAACANKSAYINTLKCDLESISHKFCLFVTLTYDQYYVPKSFYLKQDGEHLLVSSDGIILGSCRYNDNQIRNHVSKCNVDGFVPVLAKKDLQKFLKRLRKRIPNEKIRYYAIGEYGPVHFRPHYHLLLWFSQQQTLSNIIENIRQSWPFGRVDASLSKGGTSSYVARYVNSIINLPTIYQCEPIRPFQCHSQFLGEAFLRTKKEEVYEMSVQEFITRKLPVAGRIADVPLWRSLTSTYFPKCRGYNEKSTCERTYAYLLNETYRSWTRETSTFEKAKEITLTIVQFMIYGLVLDKEKIKFYNFIIHHLDADIYKCIYNADYKPIVLSIYNMLRTSIHFIDFCCDSDIRKVPYMVKKIDNFYKDLELYNLNSYLKKQEEYSIEMDCKLEEDFSLFYPDKFLSKFLTRNKLFQSFVVDSNKKSADRIKHKRLNDLNQFFNY